MGINARNNLFGPGNRANATIGRSIRLILMNTRAAIPGLFDRTILGHPGKYSYCIAEAETETHWNPLHVEGGFAPEQSAVTVFACDAPRQVRVPEDPETIIATVADVASTLGTNLSTVELLPVEPPIVRQGEIAVVVSGRSALWDGWSKDDFRKALHPQLRRSIADLKRAGQVPGQMQPEDEATFVSLVPEPEDIMVVFAGGGDNTQCAVMLGWGPKISSTSVTRTVTVPTG